MDNMLAAQYLRVSTERQEYSLDCQRAGIETYARRHGFTVCRSYVDEAKSGLDKKRRQGLCQLLQDVLENDCPFRSILVYDVSRWGRFQDPDEAAHYEFLCKTAGAPVHYCAEHFLNDGYLPNVILKTLKRLMAGEYSRELSDKVFAALIRNAKKGLRVGGRPGFGVGRMLLSKDGVPQRELHAGEWKSVTNQRMVSVVGSEEEAYWVRQIFTMYASDEFSMQAITDDLNRRNVPYLDGRPWTRSIVSTLLTHPKYRGTAIYNRTTSKLRRPQRANPESEWIVVPNAFPAIVDAETFERVQTIRRGRLWNPSDAEILSPLRRLYELHGRLSGKLIREGALPLSADGYRRRFGGLAKAFAKVGYDSPRKDSARIRLTIQQMRRELMDRLLRMFPKELFIHSRGPSRRNCLRLKNGPKIAIRVCRSRPKLILGRVWMLHPPGYDKGLISLVAGANADCSDIEFFYLLPPFVSPRTVELSATHKWLEDGVRITSLNQLCIQARAFAIDQKTTLRREPRTAQNYFSSEVRERISKTKRLHWQRQKATTKG